MISEWPPAIGVDPFYSTDRAVIYHADCRDILPRFPERYFAHAIFDPPFSEHVHTNTRTNKGTDGQSGGAEHELGFDHLTAEMMSWTALEVRRLVARWSLIFSDIESTHLWRSALCDAPGERPHEYMRTGLWVKRGAMPQVTGDRPGQGYESIVITHADRQAGDGRTVWNGGGRCGIWYEDVPRRSKGRVHPSEKPWRLLAQLIRDFARSGEVVLDPFAGSGSLGRAALDVRTETHLPNVTAAPVYVVMVEAQEQWCEEAASRLGAPVPERDGQTGLLW